MKAARFEYHAPTTLDEAIEVLDALKDDAKLLAGGQSLVPMLGLRLTRFAHLIDLNRIEELSSISVEADSVRIGAMTRQASVEHSDVVEASVPLLSRALPHIGHFQIRNRGTLGGSIAHADPASELPTVARVLDAELEVVSVRGTRRIIADDFFVSMWETTLEDDEILVAVHFPKRKPGSGYGFEEMALRTGDFALAGAACSIVVADDGRIADAAIGLLGMDQTPVHAKAAEALLVGRPAEEADLAEAAALASSATNPTDDVHASASYRTRVGTALVQRSLSSAMKEALRG